MTQPFEGEEDKKDRPKDIRIRDIILPNSSRVKEPKLLYRPYEISGSGFSFCAEVSERPKILVQKSVHME